MIADSLSSLANHVEFQENQRSKLELEKQEYERQKLEQQTQIEEEKFRLQQQAAQQLAKIDEEKGNTKVLKVVPAFDENMECEVDEKSDIKSQDQSVKHEYPRQVTLICW